MMLGVWENKFMNIVIFTCFVNLTEIKFNTSCNLSLILFHQESFILILGDKLIPEVFEFQISD